MIRCTFIECIYQASCWVYCRYHRELFEASFMSAKICSSLKDPASVVQIGVREMSFVNKHKLFLALHQGDELMSVLHPLFDVDFAVYITTDRSKDPPSKT